MVFDMIPKLHSIVAINVTSSTTSTLMVFTFGAHSLQERLTIIFCAKLEYHSRCKKFDCVF